MLREQCNIIPLKYENSISGCLSRSSFVLECKLKALSHTEKTAKKVSEDDKSPISDARLLLIF